MKLYRYLYKLLPGLALILMTGIRAQPRHLKLRTSADLEYANLKYTQAITLYQQIVRKHPGDAYAISRIADCYWRMRDFNNALLWYEKLQIPAMDSVNMAGYIHVLMANGQYTEAQKHCKEYINLHPGEMKIGGLLQHLQHLDLFFRDSANWKADFVNINSDGEDFCPVFYNRGLVFVSNRSKNERIKKRTAHSINVPSFCKIYYIADTSDIKTLTGYGTKIVSENQEVLSWEDGLQGGLTTNKNLAIHLLNIGVKTRLNVGPVTFSSDGKTVYYNWNGKIQKDLGVSRLELFSASYNNGCFTGESSFKYNGIDYSVEHPSLSPDGQFLYFASNKKGGVGAFDIYSCKRKDSSWEIPKNLGKLVNTDGNEMFPFADAMGNLYFASDGWPGLGALDIFYVKMKDGMPIGPPLNLGYPVNSSHDDFGIVLTAGKTSGYFSSNRRDGNDDIYHFDYLKNENENVKVPVLDTISRLRTDGVIVNRKEEKETINNWSVYVEGSSADTLSQLWIKGALVNKGEEQSEYGNRLVYVIGTVLDSISKLHMDGVSVDMKEVEGSGNFHFITNNSGNFGAYWKNECLLDITITKPGYHAFHKRVYTEQLRNHFMMTFLKPGIDISEADSIIGIPQAPLKIIPPASADGYPMTFEAELRHLTDSLHTTIFKRYSVYYNLGSSIISLDNRSIIDSVVNITKDHPNAFILVAGFTDCRGDSVVNRQLAKKRAGAVERLLQKLGVPSSRINIEYFGKKRLIIPCREGRFYDKEKQRVNRRSEIVLTVPMTTSVFEKIPAASPAMEVKNASVSEKTTGLGKSIVSERTSSLKKGVVSDKALTSVLGETYMLSPQKNTNSTIINGNTVKMEPYYVNRTDENKKTNPVREENERIRPAEKMNGSDLTETDKINEFGNKSDKRSTGQIDSSVTSKESDLIEEMSKRISRKPILLYTTSDSVHIEMYDNGVFDYDTISVIYNGKLTVFKQLLQVDKPISFYVKVDRDERKNEMIFFADNLGLIPPNSALMVITDGEGKRTEVSVTNDMGHNAVIYFIKPKKQVGH